ncbi:MAG: D-alanine--D-alanine ligase [Actinobacteria bacterium]|nr:D-alanine--D-alanine ligase [Actinomycetota bacterium]
MNSDNHNSKINIVVLFGGESAEHDVSCVTAAHVLRALNADKYEITTIGITRNGDWVNVESEPKASTDRLVATGKPTNISQILQGINLQGFNLQGTNQSLRTVVIPLLHGPMGEDGTVQGALELAHVAYVGAGVLGSAIAMDKSIAKQILALNEIPQPKFISVRDNENLNSVCDRAVHELGLPVFVKPANMGSSIGVTKAKTRDEIFSALQQAFEYDEWALIEEAIVGREIEVAILGNQSAQASVPGEIIPGNEFYDYEDKYLGDLAKLLVPAPLTVQQTLEVQQLALKVFAILRSDGMARIDFFFEENGRGFLCNEINTIPGFTPISMYPKLWNASGLSYPDLLDRLINLALDRHANHRRKTSR